jgi:hypothetical protein
MSIGAMTVNDFIFLVSPAPNNPNYHGESLGIFELLGADPVKHNKLYIILDI